MLNIDNTIHDSNPDYFSIMDSSYHYTISHYTRNSE